MCTCNDPKHVIMITIALLSGDDIDDEEELEAVSDKLELVEQFVTTVVDRLTTKHTMVVVQVDFTCQNCTEIFALGFTTEITTGGSQNSNLHLSRDLVMAGIMDQIEASLNAGVKIKEPHYKTKPKDLIKGVFSLS